MRERLLRLVRAFFLLFGNCLQGFWGLIKPLRANFKEKISIYFLDWLKFKKIIEKYIIFIKFYIASKRLLWHNINGNRMGRGELCLFLGFAAFLASQVQENAGGIALKSGIFLKRQSGPLCVLLFSQETKTASITVHVQKGGGESTLQAAFVQGRRTWNQPARSQRNKMSLCGKNVSPILMMKGKTHT